MKTVKASKKESPANPRPLRSHIVFILDRSGSMSGLEEDTIGGFNSMLEKQKQEPGEARVTTVLFDDRYELLHDGADIAKVPPMTNKQYFVRGSTALLDALGGTIKRIAAMQKQSAPEDRADKVLFVITTDGLENASREYSYDRVKEMVEHEKEKYGWEFIFLGANIDAVAAAGRIGIGADRAVKYHADSRGTRLNYETVGRAVSQMRMARPIEADWKADIEKDFKSRKSSR